MLIVLFCDKRVVETLFVTLPVFRCLFCSTIFEFAFAALFSVVLCHVMMCHVHCFKIILKAAICVIRNLYCH
jgi:hypothetical protein